MALTQVSTSGIKDATIATADIAADQITGALIADDAVGAEHIEDLDANVKWLDSQKAVFGAGDDLQLYHDGSYSYVKNSHAGGLWVSSDLVAISNGAVSENMAKFIADGAVELYHNHVKKLNTESWGVEVVGTLRADVLNLLDNEKIKIGDASDLEIYHDASNSYILNTTGNLILRDNTDAIYLQTPVVSLQGGTTTSNKQTAKFTAGGAVELYYDDVKHFQTTSSGIQVISQEGTSAAIELIADEGDDAGDNWEIRSNQDVNDLTFRNNTSGSLADILTLEKTGWVTLTNHVSLPDNVKVKLGGSSDLEIYHDGSNSYIEDTGTGSLYLKTDSHLYMLDGSDNTMLEAVAGGAIKLRYNNSQKFETTSTGVKVTGTINETGQEHDIWRLSSSLSSSDSTITANLERDDTLSFSIPGTGMTQSSGVFTFPSTGYWEVTFISTVWDTDAVKYGQIAIWQTNDNANYVEVSKGLGNMHADASDDVVYVNVIAKQIVDVTSTTNVKVKFRVTSHATLNWNGSSTVNMTYMMFKRLGDT